MARGRHGRVRSTENRAYRGFGASDPRPRVPPKSPGAIGRAPSLPAARLKPRVRGRIDDFILHATAAAVEMSGLGPKEHSTCENFTGSFCRLFWIPGVGALGFGRVETTGKEL